MMLKMMIPGMGPSVPSMGGDDKKGNFHIEIMASNTPIHENGWFYISAKFVTFYGYKIYQNWTDSEY